MSTGDPAPGARRSPKAAKLAAILETGSAAFAPHPYLPPDVRDARRFLIGHPRLYALVQELATPTLARESWSDEVPDPASEVVLNLGCGTRGLHPDMINVDAAAFPHVDVQADLDARLPIVSGSVDAVVSIAVLEHLKEPARLVAEIARVLKPGGICYLATPFLYPFHAAPADYTRWTLEGLRSLLGDSFEVVGSGSRGGAAGVFILVMAHLLAQICCFGSVGVYTTVNYGAMIALSPLKLLDLVLGRLPFAAYLCPDLYVVAKKR
jgi:SAM-dependent methyltransferase